MNDDMSEALKLWAKQDKEKDRPITHWDVFEKEAISRNIEPSYFNWLLYVNYYNE